MAKFIKRTRKNATVLVDVWHKTENGVEKESHTVKLDDVTGDKAVEVEICKVYKGCLVEIQSITYNELTYRMPTEKFYELSEIIDTQETK